MKKAFTMIELVFVIVIVGILSALMLQRSDDNKLILATNQLISHIRHTQHLAMMNDVYSDINDSWYKARWQIFFTQANNNSNWSYIVYSNQLQQDDINNVNQESIAKDPLSGLLITGVVHNDDNYSDNEILKIANLYEIYGVTNIEFSTSCRITNSKTISFDRIGRPLKGKVYSLTHQYKKDSDEYRLITQTCKITLFKDSDYKNICIEPETGYIHHCN